MGLTFLNNRITLVHYFQLFFSAKSFGRVQRFAGSSGKKSSLPTKRLGFFSLPPRLGGVTGNELPHSKLRGIECHSVLDSARPVLDTGKSSPFLWIPAPVPDPDPGFAGGMTATAASRGECTPRDSAFTYEL